MPITMGAFLIGSLSIVGLPPLGGVWSKWTLAMGALDAGNIFAASVLMLSSMLSIGYLFPIVARAFFLPGTERQTRQISEAPVSCLLALSCTALLCLILFFQGGSIADFLQELFQAR